MSFDIKREEQDQIIQEVIDFVIKDPVVSKPMDFSDVEDYFEDFPNPSTTFQYIPPKSFGKSEKFEPLRISQAAMKDCSRSEDPYLELVNEAVYGSTENHPKEGSEEYFKAAECFAIYGKGFLEDIKDSELRKDPLDNFDVRPQSKPLNPYAPNILFSKENDFNTPLSLATYPNLGTTNNNLIYPLQPNLLIFQPTSQYFPQSPQNNMKIQQMAKSLYKNATALNAAQQILLQANQQTNYNQNLMSYPFYPTLNQPLLYANPMLASSYFNAWVKETQINTAIFQQQHYNVYENNMLIYAQMQQQTQKITQTVIAANKFHKQMGTGSATGSLGTSVLSELNEGESSSCFSDEVATTQSVSTSPIKILTKGQKDVKGNPTK